MLKTIKVCDYCGLEKPLRDFCIPWPSTTVVFGGRMNKPIAYFNEDVCAKQLVLCDECAVKAAKALVELARPKGVAITWENTK